MTFMSNPRCKVSVPVALSSDGMCFSLSSFASIQLALYLSLDRVSNEIKCKMKV